MDAPGAVSMITNLILAQCGTMAAIGITKRWTVF